MKPYQAPTLLELGDIASLTAANQVTSEDDSIFNNGQAIAGSIGSRDACISPTDDPQPGDVCT